MQSNPANPGLTVIGILNIVFGALLSIIPLIMLVVAGMLTNVGMKAASEGGRGGEGVGALFAFRGGALIAITLIVLALNVMLIVAGVGILRRARWGRILSLIWAVLTVLLVAYAMVQSFHECWVLVIGYAAALLVLL